VTAHAAPPLRRWVSSQFLIQLAAADIARNVSAETPRAGDAEHLAAAFGIKTVRDLGSSKYFAVAQALVALGAHSG